MEGIRGERDKRTAGCGEKLNGEERGEGIKFSIL
jgi:hypothetical protein